MINWKLSLISNSRFDPKTLPKYPTNLLQRRAQKIDTTDLPDSEHLLNVLEKIPSTVDLNDILITPTERTLGDRRSTSQARRVSNARYGYARALNLTIAEDAEVEKIRRQSLKIFPYKEHLFKQFSSTFRHSPAMLGLPEDREISEDLLIETLIFHTDKSVTTPEEGEEEMIDSKDEGSVRDLIMELMPWERELLKKDMIIAPDGYIPNSVVRKKVNYVPEPLPSKSPWRLKSAPTHDPRFLPDGWADKKEEAEVVARTPPLSTSSDKDLGSCDKIDKSEQIEAEVKKTYDIPEFDAAPVKAAKKAKTKKQKEKYKRVELRKHDFKKANLDLELRKNKVKAIEEDETCASPTTLMETLHDTDETSGYTASTGSLKVDAKDLIPESLLGLLKESWFPPCDHNTDAMLLTLIKLLASDDSNVVSQSSNFLSGIYHLLGLSENYGDLVQELVLKNLDSKNLAIVQTTLQLIRKLELTDKDVLRAALPILLSQVPELRGESMLLINNLAGVMCKDGLRQLMIDLDIIKSFDTGLTEKQALEILQNKLGKPEVVDDTQRVLQWVDTTVAGVYDNERKKMEKKTRQDSLVRRWSIKAKLKQHQTDESGTIPDDEAEEDELWKKMEALRRGFEDSNALEEEEDPDELRELGEPTESSHSKKKKQSVPRTEGSMEDTSTRVPNVSRVSGYDVVEGGRTSASPLEEDEEEFSPDYWETPTTLSEDFTEESPSLENYSEMLSSEGSSKHVESPELKEYREKSKHSVVPERRKPAVKLFRPKIPKILPDKKKRSKSSKKSKKLAKASVSDTREVKVHEDKRSQKVQKQLGFDKKVAEPSKRLKEYAQLAECIKEDGDFIKKALGSQSQEDINKRLVKFPLKDGDALQQQTGDGVGLTTLINLESTASLQSVLKKTELLKKAESFQSSDSKDSHLQDKDLMNNTILEHEDSGINEIMSDDVSKRKVYYRTGILHVDEDYLKPAGLTPEDSGIARDLSDASNFSHGTHPGTKGVWLKHEGILSPVKSCSNVDDISPRSKRDSPDRGRNWQPVLDTQTASDRKRLDMVKRDYETGNVKAKALPPIKYLKDGPMVPGEAGLRLLHTVQFDREKSMCERHRVQPMEGRLSYHTESQRSGQSDFGAIKMRWTTEIPLHSKDQPTDHHTTQRLQYEEEQDFIWDKPMPPAPPRGSRTMIPSAHHFHQHYCHEYRLAKKKLHHYTSENIRKFSLPRIINTREFFKRYGHVATGRHQLTKRQTELLEESAKHTLSPTQVLAQKKLSKMRPNLSRHSALGLGKFNLPPICLNQLINGIKLKPIILPEA